MFRPYDPTETAVGLDLNTLHTDVYDPIRPAPACRVGSGRLVCGHLKADRTSMLSDMLQASFQRFASQFNTNSGGQGNNSKEDTILKQVLFEPTVDVVSDDDIENFPHRGPEDQSEGEITEGEADPADSGLPTLEQLKMSKEEQQDYDAFSLASVSVPTRPWRAMGDSRASQSQPLDNAKVSQARPQAIAKAQSIKSSSSDQRSASITQIRDKFSFAHLRTRLIFLSWCPKVKARGQSWVAQWFDGTI